MKKISNSPVGLRKYSGLISLVVLFLILTVALLGLSAWSTSRLAQNTQIINVAGEQGASIQQLSKNLLDINLYLAEQVNKPAATTTAAAASDVAMPETNAKTGDVALADLPQEALFRLQEIKQIRDKFESTLSAFEKGGEVTTQDGSSVTISAVSGNAKAAYHAANLRQVWEPYLGLIDSFLSSNQGNQANLRKQVSDYLVDYSRLYNQTLLTDSSQLAAALNSEVVAQASMLQKVQLGGIIAAVVLFFMIVFGALRQLVANDHKLAIANEEMSEIMVSVNEGLFLVDKDLTIGSQYSRRLEDILGQKDLGNKNLLDVLDKFVPPEEVETTKFFIEQLYSDWVMEDLIEDLNPLNRISVQDERTNELRFMDFKFFRVWINDKIERVLVSVTDTTESVMLQASLEAQKEQENREMEMLSTILNTNPVLLNNFIGSSTQNLDEINQILKSPGSDSYELQGKVQYIARLIHKIKGEASSLKLQRMVGICESFEESLKVMRNSRSLTGQDFFGLVVLLEDLYRLFDILKNYSGRMGQEAGSHANQAAAPSSTEPAWRTFATAQVDFLKQFVGDIATRNNKQAQLVVSGFDQYEIKESQWDKLKNVMIQLLRNSVVHGIEAPEVRQARGKPAMGTLKLTLTQQADGNLVLAAEDDGNGIDFEAIRQKAVNLGLLAADAAPNAEQKQLLNMMFSNGFSTAANESEDAGRGVGMDIIKDEIQSIGGRIGVTTAAHQYTRFSIKFPQGK
ncbi:ATP-binding protein [Kingella kingae]|uniref:ATP-binding protein n=1 Tax=Kingella kingae TaxID=504 RepID=UPI0002586577|nr:ATP-binding protein [Kingella kingae]EIC13158.1 putative CheA signal transduction histidine kinase [Kingella kingae PYKK081]MBD3613358.1 Hpt domain-containing protein [Kingella kingae]MBD3631717.1 Hpt domain-containing protein [Kingella kingae]MBD3659109.1 Hpt domain-containing protein [Kingella kingae]MDK4527906.1 ATP-binding protein [Kingella kingae]